MTYFAAGVNVAFGDGSVRLFPDEPPEDQQQASLVLGATCCSARPR